MEYDKRYYEEVHQCNKEYFSLWLIFAIPSFCCGLLGIWGWLGYIFLQYDKDVKLCHERFKIREQKRLEDAIKEIEKNNTIPSITCKDKNTDLDIEEIKKKEKEEDIQYYCAKMEIIYFFDEYAKILFSKENIGTVYDLDMLVVRDMIVDGKSIKYIMKNAPKDPRKKRKNFYCYHVEITNEFHEAWAEYYQERREYYQERREYYEWKKRKGLYN